jgi:hypothetical protein
VKRLRHLAAGCAMSTLIFSGAASADAVVNDRFPFTQFRFNACTGEELVASGALHRVESLLSERNFADSNQRTSPGPACAATVRDVDRDTGGLVVDELTFARVQSRTDLKLELAK